MRRHVVLVVAVVLAAVAGCDSDDPGTVVTGELAGRQEARLDVVSGSDTVEIRAADLGDQLFRAATPPGARTRPVATVTEDAVRVSLTDTGAPGAADLVVELNTRVRWQLRLDGGAKQATITMTDGHLSALDLGAGNTRVDAHLPHPRGTVPVRMTGGASTFDVTIPRNVATQVRMTGGASSATIDGTTHTGIAGGTVYTPDNWTESHDRYLIDNVAGVSTFTVHRPPT